MGSSPSRISYKNPKPSFRCVRKSQRNDTNSSPIRSDMDCFKKLSSALNGCRTQASWTKEYLNYANC
ncbi:unnamed protein product [Blepharisma stoltei]|uniref:Uncharacterized protein n=1 Tax=Blepharisma stoltei TaxID=1481888 RepID=A0AAU9J6L8_9CILI|nr:unnamed protein product [Blepharisma stoltei]